MLPNETARKGTPGTNVKADVPESETQKSSVESKMPSSSERRYGWQAESLTGTLLQDGELNAGISPSKYDCPSILN